MTNQSDEIIHKIASLLAWNEVDKKHWPDIKKEEIEKRELDILTLKKQLKESLNNEI
jgi:hypothetical protein